MANARIEGLVTDLKISGESYNTGLTLYFVGYVLFELPCNIILKRTTPKVGWKTRSLCKTDADIASSNFAVLASHTNNSMGYRCYIDGCYPELGGFLRRTVFVSIRNDF